MKILWVEDSPDLTGLSSVKKYFTSFLNENDIECLEKLKNAHFFKLKKALETEISNPLYIRAYLDSAWDLIFRQNMDFDLIILDVKFPLGNDLQLIEKIKKEVFTRYEDIEPSEINQEVFNIFNREIFTEDTQGIILFDLIYNKLRESKSDNEIKQMICFFSGNDEDCNKFETRLYKLKNNKYSGVRESMKLGKDLFFKKSADSAFLEFINARAGKYSVLLSRFFNSGLLHSFTHGRPKTIDDFKKIKKMSFYSFLSPESQKLFECYFEDNIDNEDFKNHFRLDNLLDYKLFDDLCDEDYDSLKKAFNNKYAEVQTFEDTFNMIISNINQHSGCDFTNSMFNYTLSNQPLSITFTFLYPDTDFNWDNFQNGKTAKHLKTLTKYGCVKISNNNKVFDICSGKFFDDNTDTDNTKIEITINLSEKDN